MRGNFSTAGIPYSNQHGLVDNGPRRYETADTDRPDSAIIPPQAQADRRYPPFTARGTAATPSPGR